MKNIALILLFTCCLVGCKSPKNVIAKKANNSNDSKTPIIESSESANISTDSKIISIIDFAKQFDGVKYKTGGTSDKGMDCSGLVTTAYKREQISLPRTTGDLATSGNWIDLKEVQKGDLLFFATRKNNSKINHVGLVTDVRPGFVEFIHATTSSGVIISNLAERYWYYAFVQARRIL